MSGTLLRAKLSGVRALSTVLLALALASPAEGQVFGVPRTNTGNSLWLSAGIGRMPAVSIDDEASNGLWVLRSSRPVQLALDWGQRYSTVGVTVRRNDIPMRFEGSSCHACSAEVQSLMVMGTYRRAAPLFGSGLLQITELGAGMTRWSGLSGRDGAILPAAAANNDFTYSVSIGLGLPVGEAFELSVNYDVVQVWHERAKQNATAKSSSSFAGLSTLRAGARIRLFK